MCRVEWRQVHPPDAGATLPTPAGNQLLPTTHLYPWALYTIPPHAINDARNSGELTDAGVKLVKTALVALFEL